MARTSDFIKDYIKSRIAAKPNISTLADNPDFDDSIIGQFVGCIAEVVAEHDEVADAHVAEVNRLLDGVIQPHTFSWIREKVFEFRYDANNPQLLEETDGVLGYPEITEIGDDLNIISVCAVRTTAGRVSTLLLAKNDPPEILTTNELNAVKGYMNNVLPGFGLFGITYTCTSLNPDYCFVEGTVYFDGLYSATIQANVEEAIETYLATLNEVGAVSFFTLQEIVNAVPGVKNFVIVNLALRANATAFASKSYIIQASVYLNTGDVNTTAGYAYSEIETGQTLADKITYTPF